jgi:predicted RNA binding protein YcfA (HicA-like mRNA interferase family)
MKVRDVIRMLSRDGWYLVRSRGSHRHFRHPHKPGLVTVAGAANHDLAPKTFRTILRQANLTRHKRKGV